MAIFKLLLTTYQSKNYQDQCYHHISIFQIYQNIQDHDKDLEKDNSQQFHCY